MTTAMKGNAAAVANVTTAQTLCAMLTLLLWITLVLSPLAAHYTDGKAAENKRDGILSRPIAIKAPDRIDDYLSDLPLTISLKYVPAMNFGLRMAGM